MSFKREGDDPGQLGVLQRRRIADLLANYIPEEEALLLRSGKYACTVCAHRPVFDTLEVLTVHRAGRRHRSRLPSPSVGKDQEDHSQCPAESCSLQQLLQEGRALLRSPLAGRSEAAPELVRPRQDPTLPCPCRGHRRGTEEPQLPPLRQRCQGTAAGTEEPQLPPLRQCCQGTAAGTEQPQLPPLRHCCQGTAAGTEQPQLPPLRQCCQGTAAGTEQPQLPPLRQCCQGTAAGGQAPRGQLQPGGSQEAAAEPRQQLPAPPGARRWSATCSCAALAGSRTPLASG
ncbi:sodium channel modifier 1 isoform X2 [Pogoniulus pusillus]|uniref:sodium channel modifier 1 isoform X2 n=1 Tax=Pogoniulus pusillus TaxID=488313 RepID=UPI0030B97C05